MNSMKSIEEKVLEEKPIRNPQLSIYNRHFYLRGAEQEALQVQRQQQIKKLANKPKITPSSYQILSSQLDASLLASFNHAKQQQPHLSNSGISVYEMELNFDMLQSIVAHACQTQMDSDLQHFCSQLWLILGSYRVDQQVPANLLLATLRILMDPYNLSISESAQMLKTIEQFHRMDRNRSQFLKIYPDFQEETLDLKQLLALWKKIKLAHPKFAQRRPQVSNLPEPNRKSTLSQKTVSLAESSLRRYLANHQALLDPSPELPSENNEHNELSNYLSQPSRPSTYFNKPNYHEILYNRKLAKDTYVEQSAPEPLMISRTAKPEQIKEIVSNLYVVKHREDADLQALEEQKELKECTFSPKINKNYHSARSVSPCVRGFEQQIGRLKKGREEKERKRQAYQNLGRVKNQRALSRSPSQPAVPSFLARDAPKLILEINIDGDRVEKLALRGDENPRLVSRKFVSMHGLEEDMVGVLQSLVREQIQNLN